MAGEEFPKSEFPNSRTRKADITMSWVIEDCDDEEAVAVHELEFWGVSLPIRLREGEGRESPYDLGERTARFGESVIRLAKRIQFNPVNNRFIDQFVGAGTSVGANYCEADDGHSGKDFHHRIGICRKEAKEAKYWLRLIATAEPTLKPDARELWAEANALNRIFGSIWRKTKPKA